MARKKKVGRSGPPLPEDDAPPPVVVNPIDGIEGVEVTSEDAMMAQAKKLQDFGLGLVTKRDKWIAARGASGVETRWSDSMNQYLGVDDSSKRVANMMESAREGYPVTAAGETKATRSNVVVNITRTKTNAAEARLADMLLPTDDQNWGIKPSPVPEMVKNLDSQKAITHVVPGPNGEQPGQPIQTPVTNANGDGVLDANGQLLMRDMTEAEEARRVLELATQSCDAMALEIADQLQECFYNTEARSLIHQACLLGTGVLKGPVVMNKTRRAWLKSGDVWAMQVIEEKSPSTEFVDVWNCFPDPSCGGNVKNGAGHWEVRFINEKQIRDLAKQPKFDEDALREVLTEGPQHGASALSGEHQMERRQEMGLDNATKDLYEYWEYWGSFHPDDLVAAGVELDKEKMLLEAINGCVILINNRVVKAFINPLESGDIPYDYFVWEQADNSPFGYGVPHLMKTPQRVLNAAWRQSMDAAALAVGPQIVIKPSLIAPANKKWEVSGRKIWVCNDPNADIGQAFKIFEFNMHLQDLEALITLAMKFADEETSIPMLAQGEKGNAPDTVGGMTILMNSSNVVLRRLVKQFDDMITRPHITRYYEWNMLYSKKNTIKGDFNVDARGSSALLVKDMQNQALMQMGSYMGNGVISPMVHWDEWFREVLRSNHIDVAKIMKTDAQIAAAMEQMAKNPQQTPQSVMAAAQVQVANIRAQAQVQKTNIDETVAQNKLQLQQTIAQQDYAGHMAELEMQKQIAMLTLSTKQGISLDEIRAALTTKSMELQVEQDMADANNQLDREKHFSAIPAAGTPTGAKGPEIARMPPTPASTEFQA